MNKHLYFLSLLLIVLFSAEAQIKDSTLKAEVIGQGKSVSILYTLNGEPLTAPTVENILNAYPASSLELDQYHRIKRNNLRVLLLCSVVAFAAISIASAQVSQVPENGRSNFSKAPFFFSLGIGALVSELFLIKKNDHFGKAIEAYNSRF